MEVSATADPGRRSSDRAAGRRAAGVEGAICPELDCVRGRLPHHVLAAAEIRAERVRMGADRVLIAAGTITEEDYVRSLAAHLGVPFVPLDDLPRAACLQSDAEMIRSARLGMLTLNFAGPATVVAPRGLCARSLARALRKQPALAGGWRLTTSDRLNDFIIRSVGGALARVAADDLRKQNPDFSAAGRRFGYRWGAAAVVFVLGAMFVPALALGIAEVLLGAMFLGWLALRLAGTLLPAPKPKSLPAMCDAALPVYTVIVALWREAASVDGLLRAIARLDYPREKLDVILAVEADDEETRAAIAARSTALPVNIIPVPAGKLRTKPRALNAALAFARGAFTVVFDAEDRPDSDQLRRALAAFSAGGATLACVQARLTIDNTKDSWLTRLFTAEYAGHFDVFLDGIAALHLPLPLGGSSNHFRTSVLCEAGGWDAYNVTEDADLGLRLARLGFQTQMIASSTHEEAPARFARWLPQRTRWLKGWVQTWEVHIRSPRKLWRDLGPRGFIALQLLIGGNVIAALVHPLFLGGTALALAVGYAPFQSEYGAGLIAFYCLNLFAGYLGSGLLGFLGLRRRGLTRTAWILALTPIYWLLLSLAAWRALWQFIFAPHRWEKTEHGLARHSRRTERTTAALVALEAELTHAIRARNLSAV